ncbi:MAG: FAD-binding and (Fe-S)-binding domain-containing protein, partial [Chromatiales bacterium]|nr:FAD-binding and (Fe-S)-binding domain-containing protein [Chromatiales bacterium]
MRHRSHLRPGDPGLAARLRREIEGEVWFDPASRGRYSTDASIYQIEPIGVVAPRSAEDIALTIAICREAGAPVLPRGAGTSQCGQAVGEAVVVDTSRHLDRVVRFDEEARRVTVEPGIVLDGLNAWLKPKGLFFPVDVSPANRATIGGMAGNNSCGSRSIRYGNMVHNVHAISAILADGSAVRFGEVSGNLAGVSGDDHYSDLIRRMRALGAREADEIARRFPVLLRRVGGYNIDTLVPGGVAGGMADDMTAGVTDGATGTQAGAATGAFAGTVTGAHNMAHLLVGSEGTLGFFTEIELDLQPIPAHRVLGVCHFPTFHEAMSATRHIVALDPSAVELVDRTLVELARDIEAFRPTVERFVRGAPDALLLVEFAGEDHVALLARLARLVELMADLGYPGAVVEAVEPAFQRAVWEVRKAGLNIMMSMKGDGKPVSFVEDCAVRLEDLAEYTRRLDEIFARHGTRGTWYAHASVGTLHVRPIIDLKVEDGARRMRAIAEECFEMVREYRGSHSGEHGDGIVRSEFHEAMFGPRLVGAFEEVKDAFDPDGLFNPGKIVRPERMDDRELFRYGPGYAPLPVETGLDWSEWGGFDRAVEMCNNNGACRKADPGVMCPSYRVTMDEKHVTRGRANTLRLALTGQLGPDALTSDAMAETMALCVGCKGCRRECPTGVDMARMKIEYLHQRRKRHGTSPRERLVASLPRYAPAASRLAWLMNLRDRLPGLPAVTESVLGLSAKRTLPRWRSDPFRSEEIQDRVAPPARGRMDAGSGVPAPSASADESQGTAAPGLGRTESDSVPSALSGDSDVVLFTDTFTTWFEPENARAAVRVLEAAG